MTFDTHPDLIVQPYLNGIRLTKPKVELSSFPTIGQLFSINFMVYFVGLEAIYVDANHFTRLTNFGDDQGYYSDQDFKGTSFETIFKKETIQTLVSNNQNVIYRKQLTIFENQIFRLDGLMLSSLAFKFPVFNAEDKIIGIFGISPLKDNSIFKEAENLSSSLEQIVQTGLISHSKNILPGFNINDAYFSKQEIKCLRLLIAGKTIKLIGQQMGLSPRTVEFYLNNIKQKLNVKTKSELIEKVVQTIWPEMVL